MTLVQRRIALALIVVTTAAYGKINELAKTMATIASLQNCDIQVRDNSFVIAFWQEQIV